MKRKFTAVDMIPDRTYRVIKPFSDFDGCLHNIGESWVYTDKNFLPYDDGLTLYVKEHGQERTFRMQWRDEAQGDVISNFSEYVEEE